MHLTSLTVWPCLSFRFPKQIERDSLTQRQTLPAFASIWHHPCLCSTSYKAENLASMALSDRRLSVASNRRRLFEALVSLSMLRPQVNVSINAACTLRDIHPQVAQLFVPCADPLNLVCRENREIFDRGDLRWQFDNGNSTSGNSTSGNSTSVSSHYKNVTLAGPVETLRM